MISLADTKKAADLVSKYERLQKTRDNFRVELRTREELAAERRAGPSEAVADILICLRPISHRDRKGDAFIQETVVISGAGRRAVVQAAIDAIQVEMDGLEMALRNYGVGDA